jgi:hypothetical protein
VGGTSPSHALSGPLTCVRRTGDPAICGLRAIPGTATVSGTAQIDLICVPHNMRAGGPPPAHSGPADYARGVGLAMVGLASAQLGVDAIIAAFATVLLVVDAAGRSLAARRAFSDLIGQQNKQNKPVRATRAGSN